MADSKGNKEEWRVTKHITNNRLSGFDRRHWHIESPTSSISHILIADLIRDEASANLIAAAPGLYKELEEADTVICKLCKRLNPQHATADYGRGCNSCEEREHRLKAIAKADGKEVQ